MAKFIGEVAPVYGRWHWPLKQMEEGDWFLVNHADRAPDEVRHYVSVRAAQLGMRFSVKGHDPENPHFARVTKMTWKEQAVSAPLVREMDFDRIMAVLNRSYPSVNANPLPIWTAEEGDKVRIDALRASPTPQSAYIVMIPDQWKTAVECDALGFTVARVALQTTLESFTEGKLADIMG